MRSAAAEFARSEDCAEARESAAREVLIAGSMGPLDWAFRRGTRSRSRFRRFFLEQAQALEERGVDLFILETFTYIEEICLRLTQSGRFPDCRLLRR